MQYLEMKKDDRDGKYYICEKDSADSVLQDLLTNFGTFESYLNNEKKKSKKNKKKKKKNNNKY